MVPHNWVALIDDYVNHLRAADRSPNTISTRRTHLERLARGIPCDPEHVDLDALSRFYAAQDWATEYRRSHRASAVGFFSWAHSTGRLPADPTAQLPRVAPAKPSPKPAPDSVWREAQIAADARTLTMLRLANEAGMRRAEVAVCSTDDLVETVAGWNLIVHGKGRKDRVIPITDSLAAMIAAGARGHTAGARRHGYIFPGDDDGHLSPKWVGVLCARAMPGVWTMHKLRHRFASRAYRGSGNNIRVVQELLGHASVATTQIYLAVEDTELRQAMSAAA